MISHASELPVWKLEGHIAQLGAGSSAWRFDLNAPQLGLHRADAASEAGLLAVQFASPHDPLAEHCFTRYGDLIATYPQRPERAFSVQLDYRSLDPRDIVPGFDGHVELAMELWISVQTYLLDSHPLVSVAIGTCDQESLQSDRTDGSRAWMQGYVARLDRYITAWLHRRDQADAQGLDEPLGWRLMGHFMEKGVIRRCRLRAIVSAHPLTPAQIHAGDAAFAASPLPLTA